MNDRLERYRRELQFGVADVLLSIGAAAIAIVVGDRVDAWLSGVLVFILLLICIRTRSHTYSSVPGAVIGTLLVWLLLPMATTAKGLVVMSELGAIVGASFNAIVCHFRITGIVGLLVVAAIVGIDLFV